MLFSHLPPLSARLPGRATPSKTAGLLPAVFYAKEMTRLGFRPSFRRRGQKGSPQAGRAAVCPHITHEGIPACGLQSRSRPLRHLYLPHTAQRAATMSRPFQITAANS